MIVWIQYNIIQEKNIVRILRLKNVEITLIRSQTFMNNLLNDKIRLCNEWKKGKKIKWEYFSMTSVQQYYSLSFIYFFVLLLKIKGYLINQWII